MIDTWIDGGIGGGARQQYEEGLSDGRRTEARRDLTPDQLLELAQVERERLALRHSLGLVPDRLLDDAVAELAQRGRMPDTRFDELVSWLLGPRPDDDDRVEQARIQRDLKR